MTQRIAFFVAFGLLASACPKDEPSVHQVIGPTGGTVSADTTSALSGTVLVVSEGALSNPMDITMTTGGSQAIQGELDVSPNVHLLPDGLPLGAPSMLTIPYDASRVPSESTIVVAVTSDGSRTEEAPEQIGP